MLCQCSDTKKMSDRLQPNTFFAGKPSKKRLKWCGWQMKTLTRADDGENSIRLAGCPRFHTKSRISLQSRQIAHYLSCDRVEAPSRREDHRAHSERREESRGA